MDYNLFFDQLGIKAPDRCFEGTFKDAFEEFTRSGVFFLNEAYIEYVNSFEACLSNCLSEVKSAVRRLQNSAELSVYALFLHRAMARREAFMVHIKTFEFPERDDAGCRLLPFITILPQIPILFKKLTDRKVPKDIIAATLRQFEDCVYLTQERTGRLGFLKRYFDHMQRYVDEKILNIGRLRFEMVPRLESDILVLRNTVGETVILFDGAKVNSAGRLYGTPPLRDDESYFTVNVQESKAAFRGFPANENGNCSNICREYLKNIWTPVLKKGDAVLSVHIPNKGALTKSACEGSYIRAQEIFSVCYPEFKWNAFHCHSWMLDPQLRSHLPETSNILGFQKRFLLYAGPTEGADVFNFVFKLKFTEYKDMPEDTSLQRALKKHYLNGNYIYEYEGIFFSEKG